MVDVAKTLGTLTNWAAVQWSNFEQPASDIEQTATSNFFKTGRTSNRFIAVYEAIPAIFASTAMIVGNPASGVLKGTIVFFQGDFRDGITEAGVGMFNAFRSAYNVMNIFVTAIGGLIFNEAMYQGVKLQPTLAQRKVTLQVELDRLTEERNQSQEANRNGAQLVLDAVNPLLTETSPIAVIIQKLNTAAEMTTKTGTIGDVKKSKEYLELVQTSTKEMNQLVNGLDRANRELLQTKEKMQQAEVAHQEAVKQLKESHAEALRKASDSELNSENERVETLKKTHDRLLQETRTDHASKMEELQNVVNQHAQTIRAGQDELEQAKIKIQELEKAASQFDKTKNQTVSQAEKTLNRQHEEAVKQLEESHAEALRRASNSELNNENERVETLKKTHDQLLQKATENHTREMGKLQNAVKKYEETIGVEQDELKQAKIKIQELVKEASQFDKTKNQTVSQAEEKLNRQHEEAIKKLNEQHAKELKEAQKSENNDSTEALKRLEQNRQQEMEKLKVAHEEGLKLLTSVKKLLESAKKPAEPLSQNRKELPSEVLDLFDIIVEYREFSKIANVSIEGLKDLAVDTSAGRAPKFLASIQAQLSRITQFEQAEVKSKVLDQSNKKRIDALAKQLKKKETLLQEYRDIEAQQEPQQTSSDTAPTNEDEGIEEINPTENTTSTPNSKKKKKKKKGVDQ